MDPSKIKGIIIVVVSIFAAIYLGIAAANAQVEALAWIGGGMIVVISLLLGRRIYLLLPLMSSFSLVLPLPGSFPIYFLTELLVLGFCTMLFLMRRLPIEFKITELEIWCLLFLLCVVQVYMRNPVGFNIFGGESIGAKPYALFAVSFSTAALISILRIDPKEIRMWAMLTLIGALGNFALGLFAKLFPSIGYYLGATFSNDVRDQSELQEGRATRVSFVREISTTGTTWISSRISPLRACFHPIYAPVILFTLAAAAYSGFRSQLIIVGITYLIGIAYRGGLTSVIISGFLGATAVVLLAFVNLVMPLPDNVQRSLTFLPGTWEERHKSDAEGSNEWRVEMWKEALLTDKWITNKWIGDGLGLTRRELAVTLNINASKREERSITGLTTGQVNMMISGGYHSGPVVTIRTIGYFGLAILLLGFVRMAIHTHRQIVRCRGTEWYTPVLFICIPIVLGPVFWTLLYGTFEGGSGLLVMGCAMTRLLEKNLPLPAYVVPRRESYVLTSSRQRFAETK